MEADWSVELAAGDPVISVPWTGAGARFLDLRDRSPREMKKLLEQVEETRGRPALHDALATLNRAGSLLWTSKCGAWEGQAGDGGNTACDEDKIDLWNIDPREMDATPEEAIFFAGCYIDLLLHDPHARASFEMQERWLRRLSGPLRGVPLRCARTDFVLRRAEVDGGRGFGVTWFVETCGATLESAMRTREETLGATLAALAEERWLYGKSADATMKRSMGE